MAEPFGDNIVHPTAARIDLYEDDEMSCFCVMRRDLYPHKTLIGLFTWIFLILPPCLSIGAEIKVIKHGLGERDVITFIGPINEGDEKKFLSIALQSENAVVLFAGPGGLVRVGIEIGKIIRLKGFDTAVVSGSCESACAIAWLGGVVRLMSSEGKIGFHAAYRLNKDGSATESGRANALVGAYLNTLGLPERAVDYLTSAPPSGMNLLSHEDAQRFGIPVVFYDSRAKSEPKQTSNPFETKSPSPAKPPTEIFTAIPPPQFVPSNRQPSVTKDTTAPVKPVAGDREVEDPNKTSNDQPQTAEPQVRDQSPKKMQSSNTLHACRVNDSNFFFSAKLVIDGKMTLDIEKGESVQVLWVKAPARLSLKVFDISQDFMLPNSGERYLLIYFWHWLWGPRVAGNKLAETHDFIVKAVNSTEYRKFCMPENGRKISYR